MRSRRALTTLTAADAPQESSRHPRLAVRGSCGSAVRAARFLFGCSILSLAIAGPTGAAAPALETPPVRLTLDDAIERARAASPRLAERRALAAAAEAGRREAGASRLPALDASAGYTRDSNVPELAVAFPGTAPRTLFPNIPDNWRARVSISMPLYTGGRLSSLVEAAGRQEQAAKKDLESSDLDLVLETSVAYWDLVTGREEQRVLQEGLAAYDAHLRDATNRESAGLAAHNEVLAVQVERDQAELSRLRAENTAAVTEANLIRLVGLPPGSALDPTEPLEEHEASQDDLEGLVRQALAARPERAAIVEHIAGDEQRVRTERAAGRPQALFSGGYDYARPNRRILPPEDLWKSSWDASVNVTLSLFDGGRTSASVARAGSQLEASRQRLADFDQRVRLEVTSRLLDARTASEAVRVAAGSLESAALNRRVAQDRYREGVSPSSDLLDAENALLRAGLSRTEALARVQVARAALRRTVGDRP